MDENTRDNEKRAPRPLGGQIAQIFFLKWGGVSYTPPPPKPSRAEQAEPLGQRYALLI